MQQQNVDSDNIYSCSFVIDALKDTLNDMISQSFIRKDVARRVFTEACYRVREEVFASCNTSPNIYVGGDIQMYRYRDNRWIFYIQNALVVCYDSSKKEKLEEISSARGVNLDARSNSNKNFGQLKEITNESVNTSSENSFNKETVCSSQEAEGDGIWKFRYLGCIKIEAVDIKLVQSNKSFAHRNAVQYRLGNKRKQMDCY